MVLCDRYADSTLAYQGYGHQTDLERLKALVDFATGGLKPDLTLLFDLDVEEGLRRRAKGGEWNRLDAYDLAFYQRVRQGYSRLCSRAAALGDHRRLGHSRAGAGGATPRGGGEAGGSEVGCVANAPYPFCLDII